MTRASVHGFSTITITTLGAAAALLVGALIAKQPVYPVVLVGGLVLLMLATRHLAAAVAVLVVASLLQQAPGFGGREVTVVKLIGAVVAAGWLIRALAFDTDAVRGLRRRRAWLAVAVLLAMWSFSSAAWAASSTVAVSTAGRLAQAILLLVITYAALRQARDLNWVLAGLIIGALATTALGFATGASASYNQWGALVPKRFGGFTGDPNELGAQLVPGAMLCLIAAATPGRRSLRLISAASTLLLLAGLAATASRGAAVSLVGALIATPLLVRGIRLRAAVAAIGGITAAAVLVFVIAPPTVAHRLASFADGGTGRSDLWHVAFRMTEDHPIQGVGAGNFPVVAPSYSQSVEVSRPDLVYVDPHVVHNTYVEFFAETGVVGGCLFVLLVLIALARACRAARAAELAAVIPIARPVLVAVVGYLIAVFFISAPYEKPLWVLLAICLRLPELASDGGAPSRVAT